MHEKGEDSTLRPEKAVEYSEFHTYFATVVTARQVLSFVMKRDAMKKSEGKKAEKENCRFTKFTIICLPFYTSDAAHI